MGLLAQGHPICGLRAPRGLGLHQFNPPGISIYTGTPVLQHPATHTVGDTLLPSLIKNAAGLTAPKIKAGADAILV